MSFAAASVRVKEQLVKTISVYVLVDIDSEIKMFPFTLFENVDLMSEYNFLY